MNIASIICSLLKEYPTNLYYYLAYRKSFYRNFPSSEKNKSGKNILFLPGYAGYNHQFTFLAKRLDELGHNIYYILDYHSIASIQENALEVSDFLNNHKDKQFYVIAHSKGGLVMRYLLKHMSKFTDKIIKVITISTPYKGIMWGKLKILNLGEISTNSKIIDELDKPYDFDNIFHQYYPAFDQTAVPNSGLRPNYLENTRIEVIGHGNILRTQKLVKQISVNDLI